MKIKETKNGNVKFVLSQAEAEAVYVVLQDETGESLSESLSTLRRKNLPVYRVLAAFESYYAA